jgi:hypothetical protein
VETFLNHVKQIKKDSLSDILLSLSCLSYAPSTKNIPHLIRGILVTELPIGLSLYNRPDHFTSLRLEGLQDSS